MPNSFLHHMTVGVGGKSVTCRYCLSVNGNLLNASLYSLSNASTSIPVKVINLCSACAARPTPHNIQQLRPVSTNYGYSKIKMIKDILVCKGVGVAHVCYL